MTKYKNKFRKRISLLVLVIFIVSMTSPVFARRIRSPSLDWNDFQKTQLNQITSYAEGNLRVTTYVRNAQQNLPNAIEWMEYILQHYDEFGGGKLVLLGGAAKQIFQIAKVLSVKYDINPEKIIYIDLPRDIVSDILKQGGDGLMIQYLDQAGILNGHEAILLIDDCFVIGQDRDPIINIATILKKSNSYHDIPIYVSVLLEQKQPGKFKIIEDFEAERKRVHRLFEKIYIREDKDLWSFLDNTPRFRMPIKIEVNGDKITTKYKTLPDNLERDGYTAQVQVLYRIMSEKFALPVPNFIVQDKPAVPTEWQNFLLSVFQKVKTPMTIQELKRHLGFIEPEDENWFTKAIEMTLNSLVSQGEIIKIQEDTYQNRPLNL